MLKQLLNSLLFFTLIFIDVPCKSQDVDSIFNKGKEQFEIGNYSTALIYFNQTIHLQKNHRKVYYIAGIASYNLKDYKHAITYFKQDLILNPKNTNAFIFKAKSKSQLGKNRSALKDLKKALKIDSSNVLVLLEKSNILFTQKKYTKAIQAYLKVNSLSPKTEIVFYKLGFCEYYLNHTTDACNYWSRLEDIDDFENYETIIKTCKLTN